MTNPDSASGSLPDLKPWPHAPTHQFTPGGIYFVTGSTLHKAHHFRSRARLNYTHQNPVKHGLVTVANQYRWCSAAWFERVSSSAQVKTIYSFKTDLLEVSDDFAPIVEE